MTDITPQYMEPTVIWTTMTPMCGHNDRYVIKKGKKFYPTNIMATKTTSTSAISGHKDNHDANNDCHAVKIFKTYIFRFVKNLNI